QPRRPGVPRLPPAGHPAGAGQRRDLGSPRGPPGRPGDHHQRPARLVPCRRPRGDHTCHLISPPTAPRPAGPPRPTPPPPAHPPPCPAPPPRATVPVPTSPRGPPVPSAPATARPPAGAATPADPSAAPPPAAQRTAFPALPADRPARVVVVGAGAMGSWWA